MFRMASIRSDTYSAVALTACVYVIVPARTMPVWSHQVYEVKVRYKMLDSALKLSPTPGEIRGSVNRPRIAPECRT